MALTGGGIVKDFTSYLIFTLLIVGMCCSGKQSCEIHKLATIKNAYCKQHQDSSLYEYKLCNSDLVTFYKSKVLKGATR